MPTRHDTHLLIERLSALFRAQQRQIAGESGLKLVQLEALVYLANANRYSDTAVGLTAYLGVTKGTISQTLRALERRGLIVKRPDARDGRVQHCELTPTGRALVDAAFPAPALAGVPELAGLNEALRAALGAIQQAGGHLSFGMCQTCAHFRSSAGQLRCGLTQEPLSRADSQKICREHTAPAPNSGLSPGDT